MKKGGGGKGKKIKRKEDQNGTTGPVSTPIGRGGDVIMWKGWEKKRQEKALFVAKQKSGPQGRKPGREGGKGEGAITGRARAAKRERWANGAGGETA